MMSQKLFTARQTNVAASTPSLNALLENKPIEHGFCFYVQVRIRLLNFTQLL